jgi:hypothetical protein
LGLAFIKDGEVIKAFKVNVSSLILPKQFCANKAKAIFRKEQTEYGRMYIF